MASRTISEEVGPFSARSRLSPSTSCGSRFFIARCARVLSFLPTGRRVLRADAAPARFPAFFDGAPDFSILSECQWFVRAPRWRRGRLS